MRICGHPMCCTVWTSGSPPIQARHYFFAYFGQLSRDLEGRLPTREASYCTEAKDL